MVIIPILAIGGALKLSYVYDNLNQLTRENNAYANKTYVYTYDDAGNIATKKTYAYTTGTLGTVQSTNSYSYTNSNWGDQLTAFNCITMTYDALGNPLRYYNGNSYMFTWSNGRQLARTVKGGVTTSYTYNADGIRTGKNVSGTAVEYILDGTRIVAEKNGTHSIRYLYDPQGAPVGMVLDSVTYLYEKNLQGDVIGIYTTSGTKIASYTYDAWGNIVSSTYTSGYYNPYYYNPFRYRGYYYDTESGFYYLQSRYYDPATGRFLNADSHINANGDLQGFNMYAYCSNNPIMYVDYTGEWTFSTGYSISAFFFGGFSYSVSIAFDSSGNIAIQTSKADVTRKESGGVIGLASASIARTFSITSAKTVDDLNGTSIIIWYECVLGWFFFLFYTGGVCLPCGDICSKYIPVHHGSCSFLVKLVISHCYSP